MKKKIFGQPHRPRLSVFRSHQNIYAQIINDESASTIVSCSTLEKIIKGQIKNGRTCEASYLVGLTIGKRLLNKNIRTIVFDKGNRPYHGRIKALADGARKAGLNF